MRNRNKRSAMNMADALNFDDALDYIFIANDSGSRTYLISNDVAANASRMTSAISATAAAATTAVATTVAALKMNPNNSETDLSSYGEEVGAEVGVGIGVGLGVAVGVGIGIGNSSVSINNASLSDTSATATLTTALAAAASSAAAATTTTTATILSTFWNINSESTSSANAINSKTTISAAALVAENLYNSVAVDLGSMLINDSLLMDFNETGATGLYGDFINGSDLMTTGNDTGGNLTTTATTSDDDLGELLKMAATSVILGLMILVTIIGNVFVIAAIILERNLQNVANYLVASLAVADLFVACLVMPLGAVYEISQGWILGPELCDIWTSCDVLCCTASILHLLAIAADRYWAVTNIDYIHSRTSKRVLTMIFLVWTAAVVVSLAPQFGWKDPDYLQRIEQQKCMVSQDVAYQVFATCCSFYVPLLVILVLYWKIYQTARKRIHRRRPRPTNVTAANNNQPVSTVHKQRKRLRLRLGKFAPHEKGNTLTAMTTGTSLGLVEGNSTNTVNTVEDTEFSSSNMESKSRAGIEVTTNFRNTQEIPTTSSNQISTVSHLVALANQQHSTTAKSQNNQQQQHEQQQQQQHEQHQEQQELEQIRPQQITDDNNLSSKASRKLSTKTRATPTPTPTPMPTPTTSPTVSKTIVSGTSTTIVHNGNNNSSSSSSSNKNRVSITLPITEINNVGMPETNVININSNNVNADKPVINATTIAVSNGIEVLEDPQLQEQLQQVEQQQQEQKQQHEHEQEQKHHQQQQQQQTEQAVGGSGVGGVSAGVNAGSVPGGCVNVGVTVGAASTSNATTITSISAISPQTPATTPACGGIIGTGSIVGPLTHPLSTDSANPSSQVTPIPKSKQQQPQQQQQQQKKQQQLSSIANPMHKVTKRKETLEAKRERKAAKTLAIITGAFVVCWLPFFVMALLLPLCNGCEISDSISSLFLWLGYFNSTLNPVIYTIFSPEFRQAFKRILFGAHRPVHYRSGKL